MIQLLSDTEPASDAVNVAAAISTGQTRVVTFVIRDRTKRRSLFGEGPIASLTGA